MNMPGPILTVKEAIKKYGKGQKIGIRKIRNHYYIRTVSGRWKKVSLSTLVWYRGNGKWSVYTGKIDAKIVAKHVISTKRSKKYAHIGDTEIEIKKAKKKKTVKKKVNSVESIAQGIYKKVRNKLDGDYEDVYDLTKSTYNIVMECVKAAKRNRLARIWDFSDECYKNNVVLDLTGGDIKLRTVNGRILAKGFRNVIKYIVMKKLKHYGYL